MSIEESVRLIEKDNYAIIEFDLVGEKVNKLSTPVMVRFKELVEKVKGSSHKALVIRSAKKNMFIAGADIEEIKAYTKKEDYRAAITKAHEIFNMIEDMPIPSIAAIDGPCMGGGCELIIACDYRISTDNDKTRIGLPETKLGIIPGFGGCVRLPKLIGLPGSLDIILNGKAVVSKKAKKIGLVDEVVPKEQLEKHTERWVEMIVSGKKKKRVKKYQPKGGMDHFMHSILGRGVVFSKAREGVMKFTKGFYPAPLAAIDVMKKTWGMKRDRALDIELDAFCDVAVTDISKHLINLFFMMENVKKKTGVSNPEIKAKDVDHMAVLGAGVMGGGIAYQAADKGIDVRMKDINNTGLAIGFKSARSLWEKKLKRRRLSKFDFTKKMDKISGGLDYAGFHLTDVVVEAVIEDMEIKKRVIAETANNCREDCIIATNTSSLSVTEMSEGHPKPENFLGMHFFNPVHKMPLVEVIRGEKTSDEATATIFELSKKMGKTPVVVKDGPGFLVNRLLLPFMGEAMFLLEEGMDIRTVDRYYTHKFGMPMGPFRLLDEVGLDVGLKVLKIFKNSLGDRIQVAEIAKKLGETDRLGKKNGKGFYLYDEKGREQGVDSSIYSELGLSSPTNPYDEKECVERGIFQMINEAAMALIEDRIVESAEELDLAMIMGTGFPPFRGGLLKYADTVGTEYIAQQLEMYAAKYGVRFKPLVPLDNMAKNNKAFF